MRKIVSTMLSLGLIFSFVFPSAYAQQTTVSLDLLEEVVFEEGEFQVAVKVHDVTNLIGAGFDLHFPHEIMAYEKVTQGDFLSSDNNRLLMTLNERSGEGILHFGISRSGDVKGITGSGTLAVFTFTALKEKEEVVIDLKNLMLLDPASMEIKVEFEALTFEIHEKDIIPPDLEVNKVEATYYDKATITGITEPGATLTINDEAVEVEEDGSFSYDVTLKPGNNKFVLIATDPAGNETRYELIIVRKDPIVIKLKIGSKTVYVNQKAVEIEAAPFVDAASGRTLVPIRIVTESIGAKIEWEGTEQKITITGVGVSMELWIGKPIANVNNIPTPIDVQAPTLSPRIVAGRTVLPLRFVADNLGCEVGWDGATQTITLTYPKLNS
jgi:hypothetical protein